MARLLLPLVFMLSSCSFFSSSRTVISVGELQFSEKYFSARLVEKLKSLDGVHVKDKTLVQQIKQTLVQELISEGLLQNWGKQKNIVISKDDINELLQSLLSTPKGAIAEDILAESQVNKALLEDSLGVQILKKRLVDELSKSITVSDAEIQNYYQDHLKLYKTGRIHLKQIFLSKETEAESVMKFLRSGKFSFETLAQKYSMGAEAQNGGDMGWLQSGQGPEIDALFNLVPGVVDKIVTSPQGFHIFKVIEIQRPALRPLHMVKEEIVRDIKELKIEGAYLTWSEAQIKKTPIKTNESLISALSPSYQENP